MKDAFIRFVLCSSFALGVLAARPCYALAQGQGRAEFYASYELSVCEVVRRSRFP